MKKLITFLLILLLVCATGCGHENYYLAWQYSLAKEAEEVAWIVKDHYYSFAPLDVWGTTNIRVVDDEGNDPDPSIAWVWSISDESVGGFYESDDPADAMPSNRKQFYPKSAGTCTVYADNGEKIASCPVTVFPAVRCAVGESVDLDGDGIDDLAVLEEFTINFPFGFRIYGIGCNPDQMWAISADEPAPDGSETIFIYPDVRQLIFNTSSGKVVTARIAYSSTAGYAIYYRVLR